MLKTKGIVVCYSNNTFVSVLTFAKIICNDVLATNCNDLSRCLSILADSLLQKSKNIFNSRINHKGNQNSSLNECLLKPSILHVESSGLSLRKTRYTKDKGFVQ